MPRSFDPIRDLSMRRRELADPSCKTCNGNGELFSRRSSERQNFLGSRGMSTSWVACACVERAEAREARQARREERVSEKLAESVAKKLAESLTPTARAPREVQSLAQQLAALHALHQAGALTAEEFARAKTRLISGGRS